MRISDWSSDVCSSDLGIDLFQRQAFDRSVEDVERRGGCGEDLPVIHRINELAGERDRIARGGGFHGILITRPERGDLAVELVLGDAIFAELANGLIDRLKRLLPLARPEAARYGCHPQARSEEHTSELQSLMRISYAGFCL